LEQADLYMTGFFIFAIMKIKSFSITSVLLLLSLFSFGQIDSLEYRNIYNWKINPYDLSLEYAEVDTSLTGFQKYNPILKNTITATYLGNLGTPAKSNIYNDRMKNNTGFVFSQPLGIYFHHHEDQYYFNTKKRYTLLNYSNAGPKDESEQLLGVLHTQNVTENFNVGIDYDMISSDGRYQEQQVKQNIIRLFSSFHTESYKLHVNYYFNRNKSQMNGGIDSLDYLGDEDYSDRRNIPVKLSGARSQVFSSGLYIAHEYRLHKKVEPATEPADSIKDSPIEQEEAKSENDSLILMNAHKQLNDSTETNDSLFNKNNDESPDGDVADSEKQKEKTIQYSGFSFSHELFYNKDERKFFDDDLTESFYSTMNFFIDSSQTSDEVGQKRFANTLSLHYRKKEQFSSRISLYHERMKYNYNIIPDTSYTDTLINPIQDTIIQSNHESIKNSSRISFFVKTLLFNNFLLKGYTDYYIDGYKKESYLIHLKGTYLIKDFNISIEGKYSNQRPDYFLAAYTSNHFKWNNRNLKSIKDFDVGIAIQSSKYKLNAKIQIGQLTNHIYFDTTASVKQYLDPINILTADISKKIKLGPIHSNTRFVYQRSSNDSIIAFPEFNVYQSLYYQKLLQFKSTGGELLVQVGVDYRYSSSFYADGFMPSTGMFYRQFENKMNDFHRFDVFANFTLKRARIYIQYSYLNSALNENYYFNAPYYPSPQPVFKYGIAWSFHD